MKNWKPIFVENSKIPAILSYVTPIQIWAITLFFIVLCKGKLDEVTKRHETIHFQQFLETGVVGFVALYFWDYLHGFIKYKNGAEAYRRIRAEQEAYDNDQDVDYLPTRPRYLWIKKYKV
jgi:hypothetical protein